MSSRQCNFPEIYFNCWDIIGQTSRVSSLSLTVEAWECFKGFGGMKLVNKSKTKYLVVDKVLDFPQLAQFISRVFSHFYPYGMAVYCMVFYGFLRSFPVYLAPSHLPHLVCICIRTRQGIHGQI